MGPGIIIPLVLVAILVVLGMSWARKLKTAKPLADEPLTAPSARLTSGALQSLPTPPWRVVYEVAPERLQGIEHVLIGPAGIMAVRTSMDPLPAPRLQPPDAQAVGRAAIARGAVDDALRRCAMTSDRLVTIHWGVNEPGRPAGIEELPGVSAVDGRRLAEWIDEANRTATRQLSPAQVDLAWQTVLTAIGRPDPLS